MKKAVHRYDNVDKSRPTRMFTHRKNSQEGEKEEITKQENKHVLGHFSLNVTGAKSYMYSYGRVLQMGTIH